MGIGTEAKAEIEQPTESVADEVEKTEEQQQSEAKEEIEVYVEESDDQEDSHKMSQQQAYAAFQKEKEKRKRKNAELEEARIARERLERELNELKETVGTIARGNRPDPYDFDSTDDFYAALEKWQGADKKSPEKEPEPTQPKGNPEAEFYLFQKERELTKLLPDYEQSKSELAEKIKSEYGADPEVVFASLSSIAMQGETDIAKAFFAMNKYPSIITDLNAATDSEGRPNQIKWAKILESAANRVKTRTTKPVDAQPEPEITNTGAVNVINAEIKRAAEKYAETGAHSDYLALKAAREKANRNE